MVYYRKYRPQKIDDLDSEYIRKTLTAVLSLPEPPHAFLFTGPKGLGKTSTARIVAKVVNCENNSKFKSQNSKLKLKNKKSSEELTDNSQPTTDNRLEPCNACEQCISITNGANLDVLEIDAASNRGIDEIRDLREKIKLSPLSARKKIYIIDEVHMLTTEAFNALLKTLEEPPAHAMFILCTTELQKVPATIISRCFQVQFSPATKEEIARSFKRIAENEKLDIDEAAIESIVHLADGGFRDAHKILEELVSMGEKHITLDLLEKRYKVSSIKYQVLSIIESLQKKDTKEGIKRIEQVVAEGVDIKTFTEQLFDTLHSLLLVKVGVLQSSESRIQNAELPIEQIKVLLDLLGRVIQEMKYAVVPQLPLELAIIDYTTLHETEKVEVTETTKVTISKPSSNGVTVASMRKQLGDLARVKALYGEEKIATDEQKAGDVKPSIDLLQTSNTEITAEWLGSFWQALIGEMKKHNHTIAGVLRGCMIKQFDKKTLVIETAYTFHKERLDQAKTRAILEEACKVLTGNTIKVEVVLKS